jgi:hypothetical protein
MAALKDLEISDAQVDALISEYGPMSLEFIHKGQPFKLRSIAGALN